jgi:NMD protein affecting ribosome stability and mRNA decay
MVRTLKDKHVDYFEAILQLRDVPEAVVHFVEGDLAKTKHHVAKTVLLKSGIDYYTADTDLTKALAKKLQNQFGGQVKITSKLFSQKDGKEIYRTTILFRGIPFKKGNMVEYQGEAYKIRALGKDIFLQHEKGQKVHVKWKDMEQVKLLT